MFTRLLLTALFLFVFSHTVSADNSYQISPEQKAIAQKLIDQAMDDSLGYAIVASLTTEVGPRLGGSEAEARARDWGKELGEELGFDRVVVEEFSMPYWERGETEIHLTAPYKQALVGTALGGSGASNGEISGALVYFRNLDEIKAAKPGSLKGKTAFIDGDALVRAQTGAGYGPANNRRRVGWQEAERAGADALVIRSVGSEFHRFAHTGMMSKRKEGALWPNIPVIAISNPDADHLRRLHQLDEKLEVSLRSEAKWLGDVTSGNVVMDLIGREKPEEIVLIGAHLDSWDESTGAIDDGAGIGITTAAAKLIADLPRRPRRTIRVVMFGAEEVGLLGAEAYAKQHADEVANHVLATESDFGADTIWQFVSNVNPDANPAVDAIGKLLFPLGIIRGGSDVVGGGPDIIPLVKLGVPTVRLNQNGMDYFDLHHTPDDTLDKIDPEKLKQNVAAYAALTYLAAELDVEFRPTSDAE